jgi:programmed cell death protein 5
MNDVTPEELAELEELKKTILRKFLTKDAIERLGRIRVIKPQLAAQLELYLVQLFRSGKLKTTITDEQLKAILETLSQKKEFRLIR